MPAETATADGTPTRWLRRLRATLVARVASWSRRRRATFGVNIASRLLAQALEYRLRLPLSARGRRLYALKIVQAARFSRGQFERTTSLGADRKRAVRRSLRLAANRLATVGQWINTSVETAEFAGIFGSAMVVMAGIVALGSRWLPTPPGWSMAAAAWAAYVAMALLSYGACVRLLSLPMMLFGRYWLYLALLSRFAMAWMLLEVAACAVISYSYISRVRTLTAEWALVPAAVVAGMAAFCIALALGSVTITCATLLRRYLTRRVLRYCPEELIALDLLAILHRLETEPDWAASARARSELTSGLLDAADVFEHCIPFTPKGAHPALKGWAAERGREMAWGLRDLTRWVSTPMPSTAESLRGRVADTLYSVATGQLDSIPRASAPAAAHTRTLTRVLARSVATIGIAGMPVGLLSIALHLNLLPPGALTDYLKVGTILWAVVTLLDVLDPGLARLALLVSVLRIGPRKDSAQAAQ